MEGILAAAVTPRQTSSYEANLAASLEVVDFLCGHPLDGIVILGTTGEMVHFDVPERIKILEFAMKRSTLPVMAGVTHSTLEGTVELAQHAFQVGCAAVLAMPPYYFRYEQPEIKAFYHELARRVGVAKPILAYNIPVFTNLIETQTAIELLEEGAIHGIKDSSGDRQRLHALLEFRRSRNFHFFVGDDRLLLEARQHPHAGAISGIASAAPELFPALARAIHHGLDHEARALDACLQEYCDWYGEFPNAVAAKEALAMRTRLVIPPATPLSLQRQQKLVEFRAWFEQWLPKVQELARQVHATALAD